MPMFRKVLVVDDSPVDRRLVKGLLEKDPFLQPGFAESGTEALAMLEVDVPKLILTDMVMPEMDGLEFVKAVVHRYPAVPVVLMTAHGSGQVAAEALRFGAASYIPKSQLGERLLGTIQRVMGMVRGDYHLERLAEFQTNASFTFVLANKTSLFDPLIGLIHETASSARFGNSRTRLQMAIAVEQALLNALYHGNLEMSREDIEIARENSPADGKSLIAQRRSQEPYAQRSIYVDISISKSEAKITVRDEGPGFDVTKLAGAPEHEQFESHGGHGLVLMRTFMDEVTFNDKGNEVVMVKRVG